MAEELCGSFRARQADLLRHGLDARPGLHVRQPVASREFQSQNLAQACATAREALCDGVRAAGGAAGSSDRGRRSDRRERRASKKVTYGELVGGKKLNLAREPNAKPQATQPSGPCWASPSAAPTCRPW